MKHVEKPWGYELIWAHTEKYVGKMLYIRKGHQLSLQHHEIKDETIYLQEGQMTLVLEDDKGVMQEHFMHAGDNFRIKTGRKHRMIARDTCRVYEVSTPELDDVVRHEDSYGRA